MGLLVELFDPHYFHATDDYNILVDASDVMVESAVRTRPRLVQMLRYQ